MQTIFSSPLLQNIPKKPEQSEYALSYYLEKAIPRGSNILVLFPKKILSKLLPPIAKKKNCTIITTADKADIILAEPDGFSLGGALFTPEETKQVKGLPLVCIGSINQYNSIIPETHDLVPVQKIIIEQGIYTQEQIEIIASYSNSSIPSQASQHQPATP